MTKLTIVKPETGKKNTIEEPKVATGFTAIETVINGELDSTNNIKAEGIAEASLSSAVQTLLNTKSFAALTFKTSASLTITAASGELIYSTGAKAVITLPAATANRIVGVQTNNAAGCKVNTAGGGSQIYGDFNTGSEGVNLAFLQHIILQADGTNWFILAGESKREAKYSALTSRTQVEMEAGVELSATRPTFASVSNLTGETPTFAIGGISQQAFIIGETRTVWVNPAQKVASNRALSISFQIL